MRLASIKIENFRSIKNIEIELPQVCAIVGRNNAGKSNILEAVRRVLAGDCGPRTSSFSEDDVYLRDPKLDITIECSFEPLIEYRKLKEGDTVHIGKMQFLYTHYKRGPLAGTPFRTNLFRRSRETTDGDDRLPEAQQSSEVRASIRRTCGNPRGSPTHSHWGGSLITSATSQPTILAPTSHF